MNQGDFTVIISPSYNNSLDFFKKSSFLYSPALSFTNDIKQGLRCLFVITVFLHWPETTQEKDPVHGWRGRNQCKRKTTSGNWWSWEVAKATRFESISAVKIMQLPSSPPRLFGFATAANFEGRGRRGKNCTGKKRAERRMQVRAPLRSSPSRARDAASRHLLLPSALFSLAS